MKVWVFTSGEPLQVASGNTRMLRAGNLCRYLLLKGHDVVWWTSSFDHFKKVQLGREDVVCDGICSDLRLTYSPGYHSNIGIARLLDHAILGINFWREAVASRSVPDVIWCSYPPIETAAAAIAIGKKLNVPVILDVRDLWPDAFLDGLPVSWQPLAKLFLYPYFKASAYAFRHCDAIASVTDGYLAWAMDRGGCAKDKTVGVFPMGYPDFEVSVQSVAAAHSFWKVQGVKKEDFNICFFGTLGSQFDIETVIEAAARLAIGHNNIKFILCGDGSSLDCLKVKAEAVPNVVFPGRVDLPQIKALMELSALGLAPYKNTLNFQLNIPNKIFEYAAGSLPILSSIDGEVGKFLKVHDIGYVYQDQSVDSLVDAILAVKDRPQLLAEKGSKARTLFCESYESKIVSQQIAEFMLKVVARKRVACVQEQPVEHG